MKIFRRKQLKHFVTVIMAIAMLSVLPTLCVNAESAGQKYECEAEGNEFVGGAGPFGEALEGASGGIMVGSVGKDGEAYFIMKNIKVDKTGVYRVEVFYACSDISRTYRIGVNGKEGALIELEETSEIFEANPVSMDVELELQEGNNSLKFYTISREESDEDSEWAPNFDCIIVHELLPDPTPTPEATETPEPTETPEATETQEATPTPTKAPTQSATSNATAQSTAGSNNESSDNGATGLIIGIVVAIVVLAGVAVFIVVKGKKK